MERPVVRDPESRARTHLADERTFLAWLRTGLSLIALGLAADQFLTTRPMPDFSLTRSLAATLVIGGSLLTLVGAKRYVRARDQIEAGIYQSDARAVAFGVALVIAIGLLAIGFILFA